VKQAVVEFGAVFANEPERVHFADAAGRLTGLLVAERKTVSGISREFAETTDQSCLNRWITEVDWDVDALNQKRLAWLQQHPETRYAPSGVIPIDNVWPVRRVRTDGASRGEAAIEIVPEGPAANRPRRRTGPVRAACRARCYLARPDERCDRKDQARASPCVLSPG
jgi:hypothetical protein